MSTLDDLTPAQPRTWRNLAILIFGQAILGAQLPMVFTVGGLIGHELAPNACLATLPISMVVLATMLSAQPLASLMQIHGRRRGFTIGILFGTLGAAVSAAGVGMGSFWLFCAGTFLIGTYTSAQAFFRFAAADIASEAFRPKAISYVLAGGLAAAIIGPQLVKWTIDALPVPYLGIFVAAIALNLCGLVVFRFLRIPKPPLPTEADGPVRTQWELLTTPKILVAIICAMSSYAMMNLMMTSTPLAVVGTGHGTHDAANIVSAHVLAMYVPSFFTGHLITRFGVNKIIAAGLLMLAGAGVMAFSGINLHHFFGALILLGVGWNFAFIGATAMLTSVHTPAERGRVQGMNDVIVFGCVTLASLMSGGLMNCTGGSAVEGWTAVNLALIPFLTLSGAALIWLVMKPGEKPRN